MKKSHPTVFLLTLLSCTYITHAFPEKLIATATNCQQMDITPSMLAVFNQYAQTLSHPVATKHQLPHIDRPLLRAYPTLTTHLPWISLADLPTPVFRLEQLGKAFHTPQLYIKDDGQTSQAVGGNKLRKLELLFADAITQGAKHIITFGCTGSNHATTTAFHAQRLGLSCSLLLCPQPNSPIVRNNLLIDYTSGAHIFFYPTSEFRSQGAVHEFLQRTQEDGQFPYVIGTGGSSPLGAISYVSAIFELKEQIAQGLMPEPDYLYCPAGSIGTLTGLLLGIRAAGLKTKLIPVAVEPEEYMQPLMRLLFLTNNLLHALDASFPLFTFTSDDVSFNMNFIGPDYGVLIPEAQAAMNVFQEQEGIRLEGTYTGKAAAALLTDLSLNPKLHAKVILFWNTFGIKEYKTTPDYYKNLPHAFHHYFEEVVELSR